MSTLRLLIALTVFLGTAAPVSAARRDVLVVVNTRVPDGAVLAEAYRAVHDIPATHVVSVDVTPGESVSRQEFLARIQGPLAEWIQREAAHDEIVYIVLVRGMPLKVAPDAAARAPLVSVDSSLAQLYRVMLGAPVVPGASPNPYFTEAVPPGGWPAFERQAYDSYLVGRLDGFTLQDAVQLAGRCTSGGVAAGAGATAAPGERVVVLDGVPPGTTPEHGWFTQAADRLRAQAGSGVSVELDQTRERVRDRGGVIGYYAWGASDPAQRSRTLPVTLVPGAIGASLTASDVRTLKEPPAAWQPGAFRQPDRIFEGSADGLAGDMVRAGFTGWGGAIADPLIEGIVRPHILFPAYVSGRSLGEAYALATRHLGWRTVVFGDPLCRPFGTEPPPPALTRDERSGLTRPFLDRRLAQAARNAPRAKAASIEVQVAAQARVQQGDRAAALTLLRSYLETEPADVTALQTMALLLDSTKEREEAIRVYRALLAARPNDIIASNNLAYALAADPAHRDEALSLARRAYEQARGEATVADTYGWVLYHAGDLPQAIRVLQEAARRGPTLVDIRIHLALAYLKNGQAAEAGVAWAEARRLDAGVATRAEAAPLVAAFPATTP